MKNEKLKIQNCRLLFCILHFAFCIFAVNAQSTDQSFPTAVTTNEISGTIKVRDIGDARLTGYFYTFNGTQGDVFINVVTNNFNGDIDIFTVSGLKSLTKIVVYADSPSNETGRVIYLRKPEKLLLRIEGRSPNDDAATFRIKFAGSFQAAAATDQPAEPKLPEVANAQNDSGIVVNSVGTIISVKPKPTSAPKEVAVKTSEKNTAVKEIAVETAKEKEIVAESTETETNADAEKAEVKTITVETATEKETVAETPKTETAAEKTEIKTITVETATETQVVADNQPKPNESTEKLEVSITETEPKTPELVIENAEKPPEKSVAETKPASTKKPKTKKPVEPNPLDNVRLIIVFKDGTKIERPMSEVSRVNVDDKGMLTVVAKDGTIGRYSILEVAKFTIE